MTLESYYKKRSKIAKTHPCPKGLNPFERRDLYKPILEDLDKKLRKLDFEIVQRTDKLWSDKMKFSIV